MAAKVVMNLKEEEIMLRLLAVDIYGRSPQVSNQDKQCIETAKYNGALMGDSNCTFEC